MSIIGNFIANAEVEYNRAMIAETITALQALKVPDITVLSDDNAGYAKDQVDNIFQLYAQMGENLNLLITNTRIMLTNLQTALDKIEDCTA